MQSFISALPKAELHVHLEGTFEPEHILRVAARNDVDLGYASPAELRAAYDLRNPTTFRHIYLRAVQALCTEEDFFEVAYAYFKKAADQGIVYAEPFFNPQLHTARGIAFSTIIQGLRRAQEAAETEFGIKSHLIMGLLRDDSVASAMEHLQMSLPYKEWIAGVGLDGDERNNPPAKFADVFAKARASGYMITMHCNVNHPNTLEHIDQCLHLIHVDRIDHGVNTLEDIRQCQTIAERGTGLNICPVGNRYTVGTYTTVEIRTLLQKGIKATINSDKPAFYGAYLNDNFAVLLREGKFNPYEILQLVENAFYVSWMPFEAKQQYFAQLREIAANLEANTNAAA